MDILNRKVRDGLTKAISALTGLTTILSLSGLLAFAPVAGAVAPKDYGLKEGDTISAAGSSDPDVYIVNDWGYKRLFLNPVIFGFYGHLGGFAKVHNVSSATRDAFVTSGLFRMDGDQKVYGVESTGEDTGKLHWVNTTGAQAVADDPNFFKKVFVINANEMNWYTKGADYTSVSQVPNYSRVAGASPSATPVPAGALSVALSPTNPAAQTVTKNGQAVEMMKVQFSGSGTVSSMTFKRSGAGATGDFSNLYIYDGATRLTSGKSLSSSDGTVTFINLGVTVSGTKELSLVAALAGTAGNVDYFQLTAVDATPSVSNLPISGNNFTISGASSGGVTMAKSGSLGNPYVGSKHAQLSEFKLTANTEAASIKKLTMLQGGTLKPGDINNITLETGTNTWSGSTTKDGHLVFDLGTGFTIVKGGNVVFKVFGDLGGKADETVKLYFEENTDIWAIGDQYGYPMATTITSMDTSGEAHALTMLGGALTITFNGPNASNIGTDTNDTVLMRYSMTATSNIEVRKTRWTFCQDDGGTGTFTNTAATTDGWYDLEDFKVTDEDSGSVVMGPTNGSTFTTSVTNTCPNSATGAGKQITDVFNLASGKTRNFKATADIKTGNTNGSTDSGSKIALTSGDVIKVVLEDYTADTPDLAVMKYSDTNTSVADADIVPGADISGNNMTLQSSSLTLGLASSPASRTVVKGTKNVDVVGITFAANQASDLKVTDITITGYASDNTTTFDEGTDVTDTGVSVGNAMSKIWLVEGESGNVIADSNKVTSNNVSVQNTGTMKFSFASTPWVIPAGATRTLLVRANLSSNTASGTAGDAYAFDISATANVTALDSSSNTINAGNQVVNGTTSPTKKLTVKNAGTLVMATHADSPQRGAVYWGQVDAPISKFSITSTNEGFYMENLTIATSASADVTHAANNVKQVKLTYKNKAGSTLTTVQSFTSGASANFGWSCAGGCTAGDTSDTRPYVPKDGSMGIDVAASMRTLGEGATPANTSATPVIPLFSLDLVDKYNGSYTTGFRAVGDGSGTVINGGSSGILDVLGANKQNIWRVFPKIDQVSLGSGPFSLTGTPTVFKFSVTAMGLSDSKLRFDNSSYASGSLYFEVVSSGELGGTTSTNFSVYDENNVLIDGSSALRMSSVSGSPATGQNFVPSDANPAINASIIFDFSSKVVEIAGGQSKTFRIQLDNPTTNYAKTNSTGRAADYFQVTMQDDQHQLIHWVANYDGTANSISTASIKNVIRSLPLFGPTFTR